MTRILQLRRGTAAENNHFTGLAGEVTIDTDAAVARVHDGKYLGGHPMARADLSNVATADLISKIGGAAGGNNFDITTVGTDFWKSLFATYGAAPMQFELSMPCSIGTFTYYDYTFATRGNPALEQNIVDAVLVCQTPEAGYAISDIVPAFGIGTRANPRPIAYVDTNGLHARLLSASDSFWVSHKTNGTQTTITPANWRIKFRLFFPC
ncbi:MAG: hypothetical protein FWC51_00020 [Proteobacteria bacterium]|nr:hypothetical protein [Pseudomonadota bacterium]